VQGSTATSLGCDRKRPLHPIASTRAGSARTGQGRQSVRFRVTDDTHKPGLFAPPVAGGFDRGDRGSGTAKWEVRGTRAATVVRRPWLCPARVERAGRAVLSSASHAKVPRSGAEVGAASTVSRCSAGIAPAHDKSAPTVDPTEFSAAKMRVAAGGIGCRPQVCGPRLRGSVVAMLV
jgi:hypothetical protein